MQQNIIEIHCSTAKELLDYLSPLNRQWEDDQWIFRGQWNSEWKLIPKAWREDVQKGILKPLLSKYSQIIKSEGLESLQKENYTLDIISIRDNVDGYIENIAQFVTEVELLRQFTLLGDDLGFPVGPETTFDSGDTIAKNPRSYGNFKWPRFSLLGCIDIAQHHGIPTRLIDWTKNSFKAAFFSIAFSEQAPSEFIAVWALNLKTTELTLQGHGDSSGHKIGFYKPIRYLRTFIHAQEGLFLWLPTAEVYHICNGSWPSIESIFNNSDIPIQKLMLPVSEVQELRRLLLKFNISHAHLMPSYDNISKTVLQALN